jgi:hypothetical protein
MKKTFFLILFLFLLGTSAEAATTTPSRTETEAAVRSFFKDTPVMIEIARCESNFRQFTDAGNVLRGGSAGGMVGVFQFFESIHSVPAKTLGFDLKTLDGNLGYAKHLFETQGTTPWNSAKSCWNVPSVSESTKPTRAELEAKIKKLEELIAALTKLLTLRQAQIKS